MKHTRLPTYDSVDLDRLSYSSGDVVYDATNSTVRLMDGSTPGGIKLASEPWVTNNALTVTTLNSTLSNYVQASALSSYVTGTQLTAALAAYTPTGNIYTLPTASTTVKGGVKVDGSTITIDPITGIISGTNQYVLPAATTNALGGVKVDGSTITINSSGIITANYTPYSLPSASTATLGGVKVPAVGTSGLTNTSGTIGLATASTGQLGGVKVDGTTITVNSGIISAPYTYTLPATTTTTLGGVIVPAVANSGLTNTSGTIRLATATTNQLGGVKVDGTSITISSGVISAVFAGAITFVGSWNAATNNPTLTNGSGTNGNEYICSANGTVNFGAGNISFSVGDAVIYNSAINQWIRIPASAALSSLTFNTTGGASAGSAYNGTAGLTIDYSTVGASPLAGSSSLTTVGTIASGTWNGGIIGATYGGTGVNNGSNTITLGGNLTTAGTLTQAGAYATTLTATASTSVTLPTSGTIISSATALPGAVSGTPSSSNYLRGDGTWASITINPGTVTSVSGTGTVSGISLSGTVTSSGNLTLGGTLTLSSFNAAGAFTTLSASSTINASLQATTADGGGSIYLSNGTNNRIDFVASGVAAPAYTTRSTGTKLVLYPAMSGSSVDYGIGIAGSTLWFSTATTSTQFQWYGGTSVAATLNGSGILTVPNIIATSGSYVPQPSQTALTSGGTLTIAQMLTYIITMNASSSQTLTLPTGANTDAGILGGGLNTDTGFDWSVINIGSTFSVNMQANTSHTYIGSATVAFGTSARFRTRKTAASTFVTYRIS
jgi:hypothetical protein